MLGGLSVCFPALKGTFLQEKSKRKTLAEPESLRLTLSHAKVTAPITGVQEVSEEIIPGQSKAHHCSHLLLDKILRECLPCGGECFLNFQVKITMR